MNQNNQSDHDDSIDQTSETEVTNFLAEDYKRDKQHAQKFDNVDRHYPKLLTWLIVMSPQEQRGMVLPIADDMVIGREGDIVWHDAHMSRKHARFTLIDDPIRYGRKVFAIEPEKDRNGTIVNGIKITGMTPLRENNTIIMGDTQFVVKVLE